ncbi:MAG: hypothetical protein IKU37_01365 [Candidatus Gastranaerophilales bacterium]|nr:hypothetical protein [Candidatus Gastranaerophilales bacterium]
MIDFIIDKLTELLIKTDFEERQNKQEIYIRKTSAYRDIIKLLKYYQKNIDNKSK